MAAIATLPALPTPQTIDRRDLAEYCVYVTKWAAQADDLDEVRETAAKWGALVEYVRRTSREGVAEAEATLRRLEVRVGQLLGPRPTPGSHASTNAGADIHRNQAGDLRDLAEYPEIVEQVIAESTDAEPPSRRKVLATIRDHKASTRTRTPEDLEAARLLREREDAYAHAEARRQFNESTGNTLFCLAVLADHPDQVTDFAANYGPPAPTLTIDNLKAAARTIDQLINEWSQQ